MEFLKEHIPENYFDHDLLSEIKNGFIYTYEVETLKDWESGQVDVEDIHFKRIPQIKKGNKVWPLK